MCGIAGFCNMPDNWRENITKMNACMYHRGPDAEGIWADQDATVVLGHRRLSILDLTSAGAQPMISASGRYVIVLNGEIYNFKEISDRLIREKHIVSFRGHSDTEIILEAIESYGFAEALKLAKGMFAIAAFDRKEKKLFLGRDRIGEKPLYYGFQNGTFIFASDLNAISAHAQVAPHLKLDRDALGIYFCYGYIPSPYSIFKDIKKLEPGSILELEAPYCSGKIYKYWDIMEVAKNGQNNLFQGTLKEAAEELERLLINAIKGQMVADVPVGAFLSGGIDSTTIVALMQSISEQKVKTFTIGFAEKDFNEAQYAKETARYLGTDHTELYVTDKDAMNVIPKLTSIYGEPFADVSQIPTYLVSSLAKQKVTVSLSGDAGDELFCGYSSYQSVKKIWNYIKKCPFPLRNIIGLSLQSLGVKNNPMVKASYYLCAKSPEQVYTCMGNLPFGTSKLVKNAKVPEFKYSTYPSGYLRHDIESNIMLMDLLMYHPDDILVKVDRSGMAVSLENRIPLLDKDIVEYSWTLPIHYKFDGSVRKKVLKEVLYKYIPSEMMERPKKGFGVPISKWIRNGELRVWAEDLLNPQKICNEGVLDEKIVSVMWNRFLKTGIGETKIWSILMFEEWLNQIGKLTI